LETWSTTIVFSILPPLRSLSCNKYLLYLATIAFFFFLSCNTFFSIFLHLYSNKNEHSSRFV
jgi:hypothetical protein